MRNFISVKDIGNINEALLKAKEVNLQIKIWERIKLHCLFSSILVCVHD